MEMESSRRSIDRSKELGLKKPRLAEEVERNRNSNGIVVDRERQLPMRLSAGGGAGTGQLLSRFKANDRERDAEREDSVRRAYQQQHQELVNQYKTALTELTFNSKPIITNLTIIAGENLHAAKGIAATVCANILEVPSEQKLPSLYLLDSIVKNIGRDYIKYFAARLPEYEASFWDLERGVPRDPLQMIEKELGLPSTTSIKSSGTTISRPDSQAQCPPHSIHVNPKYLEARQRLQQSSRAKGMINDNTGTPITLEDSERPERTASIGSGRPWTDLHVKMHNIQLPQREASNESLHDKSSASTYGDYVYDSDLSRHHHDFGIGKVGERVVERGLDKSRHGIGSNLTEAVVGQRNGSDMLHGFQNYQAPKSGQGLTQLQSAQRLAEGGSRGNLRNWKNSEEEEYAWDEMKSRLTDNGTSDIKRRDIWAPDMGKQEANDHILQPLKEQDVVSRVNREASTDSLLTAQGGQATPFHQRQSVLPVQESHSVDVLSRANITSFITGRTESHPASASGLSTSTSLSSDWIGLPSHIGSSAGVSSSFGPLMNNVSGSIETSKERCHQPMGPPSPSRQSLQQCLRSPSSSASSPYNSQEQLQAQALPHPGLKSSQFAGQLSRISHQPNNQDPFPILPHDHHMLGTLQNLQNSQLNQSQPHQHIQTSSSLLPSSQLRHHGPFSTSSGQAQKPLPLTLVFGTSQAMGHSALSHSNNPAVDVSGSSSTSSLLAAIMNSGVLSNNSIAGSLPNLSFQEVGALSAPSNIQLPLPGGPPPTKSLASRAAPTSVFCSSSPGDTLASTAHPQGTAARPSLPTGPPPPSSTVDSMSSQASSASGDASNPFSCLLSSLVAKGLISASMKESPTTDPLQLSTELQNQSSSISVTSSLLVDSSPVSSTLIASSGNNLPMSESQSAIELPQGTAAEMGPIGIEFKPDIIREVHTSVIKCLFDDLPHCCSLCGFRLRHQEGLDKHLEWHASKEPEASSLSKISRRWYANLGDWIAGSVGLSFQPTSSAPVEVSVKASEKSIPMVPADESRCLCTICGELFEDFYSYERDEWMFKGAVYMDILAGKTIQGATDISSSQDPIVHASCILQNSIYDLGLAEHVKVEESTGA